MHVNDPITLRVQLTWCKLIRQKKFAYELMNRKLKTALDVIDMKERITLEGLHPMSPGDGTMIETASRIVHFHQNQINHRAAVLKRH